MCPAVRSLHFHEPLLYIADSSTFYYHGGERAPCVMTAQSDPGALHAAVQSPQAAVNARARRVLIAIGADAVPEAEPRGKPAAAVAAEAEPDLLGGLGDEPAAPPHPAENGWPNAHAKQQPQQQQAQQAIADQQDHLLGGPTLPSNVALLCCPAWSPVKSSWLKAIYASTLTVLLSFFPARQATQQVWQAAAS